MKKMNFEAEPIIAFVVNIIVGLLVSKGIIDTNHAPMIAQEINNFLAAGVTLGLGIYSTHKVVDAYKHKISLKAGVVAATPGISIPSVTTSASTLPGSSTMTIATHTGLPYTPAN